MSLHENLSFRVPLMPPSVNMYVRHFRSGGHGVTSEAKAFKAAVATMAGGNYVMAKMFRVNIKVTLGKKQKGDIDNFPKLVLDGLSDAGAFRNLKHERVTDAHVRVLVVYVDSKTRPADGFTDILVSMEI